MESFCSRGDLGALISNYPKGNPEKYPDIVRKIQDCVYSTCDCIEKYRFREAQAKAIEIARIGNQFLAETEPWKLIKQDEESVKTILNLTLQIGANLSIVLNPFLPNTCNRIRHILNINSTSWEDAGSDDILKAGTQLNKPTLLFDKIEDLEIEAQVDKLNQAKKEQPVA